MITWFNVEVKCETKGDGHERHMKILFPYLDYLFMHLHDCQVVCNYLNSIIVMLKLVSKRIIC